MENMGELMGTGIFEYVSSKYDINIQEVEGLRIIRSNFHATSINIEMYNGAVILPLETVCAIDGKTYKVGYLPEHKILVVSRPIIYPESEVKLVVE